MSSSEQVLFDELKALPLEQRAAVEDFVDFLIAKTKKHAALDRLLAIAPALQAAGVEPLREEEIDAEVKAARAERADRNQRSKQVRIAQRRSRHLATMAIPLPRNDSMKYFPISGFRKSWRTNMMRFSPLPENRIGR